MSKSINQPTVANPAAWIGIKPSGFRSGYCDHCKGHGYEAQDVIEWHRIDI